MACSECKKKTETKEDMMERYEFLSNRIFYFLIVWSGFAIYGIYTLISKLI